VKKPQDSLTKADKVWFLVMEKNQRGNLLEF
jgi:hypothetical protein